jgi:divalent metal cation (Fe/Co/Zn/Cd) transporter
MAFMWGLIHFKVKVGQALASPAILADAECSRVCMILSLALLVASAGYEITGLGGLDAIGTLAIAWLSFREGREAFAKAKGLACSCSCGGNCN